MVIQALPDFETMERVFCVRAKDGLYTEEFVRGGYVGLSWGALGGRDLSQESKDSLRDLLKVAHPNTTNRTISDWARLIDCFVQEFRPGDWVLTPGRDRNQIYIGKVDSDYFCEENYSDENPCAHRHQVEWHTEPIQRAMLPEAWRRRMHNQRTVFAVAGLEQVRLRSNCVGQL